MPIGSFLILFILSFSEKSSEPPQSCNAEQNFSASPWGKPAQARKRAVTDEVGVTLFFRRI